jgi:hypothetical protein
MKTQSALFVSNFLLVLYSNAQPVMDSEQLPPVDTWLSVELMNAVGISPGPVGPNQVWDFSDYEANGTTEYLSFPAVESSPFYANYPQANRVSLRELPTGLTEWKYYQQTTNALTQLGLVKEYVMGTNPIRYEFTNSGTSYTFPAGIDSSLTDNYRIYSNTSMGLAYTAYYESGTTSYMVDGYGTLTTPSGTYPNTLRIKHRKTIVDSTFNTMPFGPPSLEIKYTSGTRYEWLRFDAGFAIPVWSIEMDTLGTPGSTVTYQVRVSQANIGLPSTTKTEENDKTLVLFPNPATDKVLLMLKKDAQVSVIDQNGRVVQKQYLEIVGNALPQLDVSKLPVGLYTIIAEGEDLFYLGKLTVAH